MTATHPTPLSEDAFQTTAMPTRRCRPWWLRMLALTGGLMLLPLGGCLIFSLFCRADRYQTPADVLAAAHQIVDFDLPAGYVGEIAEVVETPMFAVRKAIFRHESGKGVLAVAAMDVRWEWLARNDEGLQAGLDQLAGEMRPLIDATSETSTVTILGRPAEFALRAGQDALSSTRLHEVRGVFLAKAGIAQIWWQAEDDMWTATSQADFLKSLAD